MGFVAESWFIDAFQDHFDDFLHQLIVPGLDTERTLLIAVFLRNIDPLCRLWTVTVISQRRDDLIDFLVTHAINRRSIGSGGHTSVVGVYVFIREPIELRVVQISVQPFESVQFILGFFR